MEENKQTQATQEAKPEPPKEENKSVPAKVEAKIPRKITELKVTFGALTERNREVLNQINRLCLPVVYSSEFYLALALSQDRYCRLGICPLFN